MRVYFVTGILLLLTLSSCLTIIQPLMTPGNIITDNRIEGLWSQPGSKNIHVQKLMNSKYKDVLTELKDDSKYSKQDSVFYTKHYVISFREQNLDYTWLAGLVKIDGRYYLNLGPEECLNANGEEEYGLSRARATSSIAKLEWENNNSLTLYFLNGDYIKEIILNGKARIKHEYDPLFGTFVITASTHELEQFLEKYGDNENLFKGGNTIILTRKM